MTIARMGGCLLLAVALASATARAADPGLEDELNGWRLQQFAAIVTSEMGEPFKSLEDPPFRYHAYRFDEQAYLVVGIDQAQPNHVASLQLTGKASTLMSPFKGLRLGDGRDKVLAVLGPPSDIVAVAEPKLSRLEYADRNYSVELDEAGGLYSIRLHINQAFMHIPPDDEDPWPDFLAALESGDAKRLLPHLRPDVEVYRHGRTLSIQQRFSDFAARPDPALLDAFLSADSGVRRHARDCRHETAVRVTEKMGVGVVWKFEEPCGLGEVVMFPHAGRYRVYEVAFR